MRISGIQRFLCLLFFITAIHGCEWDRGAGGSGPSTLWTRQLGSPYEDFSTAIAVDGAGSVILAGITGGALDGSVSVQGRYAFIAKYDRNGLAQWVRQFEVREGAMITDLDFDDRGNIYSAGSCCADPERGSAAAGPEEFFLASFSGAGGLMFEWSSHAGGDVFGYDTGMDREDNIYMIRYRTGGYLDPAENNSAVLSVAVFDLFGDRRFVREFDFVQAGGPAESLAYRKDHDGGGVGLNGRDSRCVDALIECLSEKAGIMGHGAGDIFNDVAFGPDGAVYLAGTTAGSLHGKSSSGLDAFVVKLDGRCRKR